MYNFTFGQENLPSGLPTELDSKQSPLLRRLASNWNFACSKFRYDTFQLANHKGADQTAYISVIFQGSLDPLSPLLGPPMYSSLFNFDALYVLHFKHVCNLVFFKEKFKHLSGWQI